MNSVNKFYTIVVMVMVCTGCFSTITPSAVKPAGASYDNGERNSGFIGYTTNNGVAYGIITPHARDRYNTLINVYGKRISLPIKTDYGITSYTTNYLITLEGLSDFALMNMLKKNQ